MKNRPLNITANISRLQLAAVFMFSGFVKAVDPLGTVYKIEDYLKAFGGVFTDLMPLATVGAWCLIIAECMLGVCLLLNIRSAVTSWLTLAFYLVMTPLTLYIALTNPVSDCGCFGDALVLTNWQTFGKNIVLLALAIVFVCSHKYINTTFVWGAELAFSLIALCLTIAFMLYNLNHLPVMDFRPYKIGNNIPQLMEVPEGAPQDEYDIHLIYEKDGEEQSFTLKDYPRGDTAWTFVRQDSRLIKKGYEPPIHDFEILNSEYEDITYDILESDSPVTLAVMYDLNKSDIKQNPKLGRLKQKCQDAGQQFYILTGSGTDDIIAFCLKAQEAGITEEDICTCDPVTLKTIVRANPGIVVVENGTIIDKYNIKK